MDDLNLKLAEIKLIDRPIISSNAYDMVTKPNNVVIIDNDKNVDTTKNLQSSLYVSNFEHSHAAEQCKQEFSAGISPTKIGPTVPPKPQKHIKLQENNDSEDNECHVKLYSSLSSRPPVLQRKVTTTGTYNSYNKVSKVTLDNPAVLEQQLEVLAHHKMQLEKKGLLQKQEINSAFNASANDPSISKPVNLSILNDNKSLNSNKCLNNISESTESSPNVYSKLRSTTDFPGNEDTNISFYDPEYRGNNKNSKRDSILLHNLIYENDVNSEITEDFPPPSLAVLRVSTDEFEEYLKNSNSEDNPPMSPVSSSYSELHRATDYFSKIAVPIVQRQQSCHDSNIRSIAGAQINNLHYPRYDENLCEKPIVDTNSTTGAHKNYINMNYINEYTTFNDNSSSQGSSTYESIYEPINPRPPSQLSTRSNYRMYVQYATEPQLSSGRSGNMSFTTVHSNEKGELGVEMGIGKSGSSGLPIKYHIPKEAEEEVLKEFLVNSVDTTNDVESYGVCVKCNERVVGENSGCTAMDQVFHILCFTCSQCQINLQGKPFYALEGKPYCEYDYLQTLEKCSICMKPILERILRATGKPYHPQCFTCVVCGNSLDGIPFTVDATNQNYCIADFHKKFAPRCCVCKLPIMPEPGQEETVRVVALDRSFHFECYKCEDCELLLSSEAEGRGCYPLDDHVLCKSCNAKRVQMLTNRMTTEL